MDIEINSIKKDGNKISPSNFVLPYRENFIGILKHSLFENPLLGSIKNRINTSDLESIKIIVNIITEGYCFYFPKRTDFAEIGFVNYFDDKKNPVVIGLHYGMYLGLDVWPTHKLLSKPGNPGSNSQIREDLSEKGTDQKGIQRVLFHELGHFIDAMDPGFGYLNKTYKKIEEERQHYIFEELWNCYLNRRLQDQLKWGYPYEYGRPYLQEAEELLKTIWRSSRTYTFDELFNSALKIHKRLVGNEA